jgi:mRNA turnover protein 4
MTLCPKFRTPEEEYNENLHKVSMILRGECGLLFTNEKTEDVLEYFENLSEPDFAR